VHAGLLRHAVDIARDLRPNAFVAPDGSPSWIRFRYASAANRFRLQPLDYSLYSGSGVLALFLAALAMVTQDAEWRDVPLGILPWIVLGLLPPLNVVPAAGVVMTMWGVSGVKPMKVEAHVRSYRLLPLLPIEARVVHPLS
jgi:lantibiotic modifying enzyme